MAQPSHRAIRASPPVIHGGAQFSRSVTFARHPQIGDSSRPLRPLPAGLSKSVKKVLSASLTQNLENEAKLLIQKAGTVVAERESWRRTGVEL